MAVLIDPQDTEQWAFMLGLLRDGQAVALPSETVYGLAVKALDEKALDRVYALKNRPIFNPLIVHVESLDAARPLVTEVTETHALLCKAFWPGPLTLLFRKSSAVPDKCTGASEWVALRSPQHPVFLKAIKDLGEPLAAPSANRFAMISPVSYEAVLESLGPWGLEAVVRATPSHFGVESSVLKVVSDELVQVLRPGALSLEQLRSVLPDKCKLEYSSYTSKATAGVGNSGIESPGQLRSHYAPSRLSVVFVKSLSEILSFTTENNLSQSALLLPVIADLKRFDEWQKVWDMKWGHCLVLSEDCYNEAASALYEGLRSLDARPELKYIVALACSERGLGLTINDRLYRAAAPRGEGQR